ncbi:hypothetical protein [Stenotrophobium rhamnosiphilum]|uniref:Uncharacterized protein n=1 Tax=Stenotrophobium rhamnosiphilum TaxID=2029166 RepID=A0A2T5MB06_9GAMM|nr:hypothetical protein [Stenotrophobium rhamnosiphilum]PTU27726.1 hypothetical protein CJD38_18135 [Stenotrophobium rhamnosiphilum]
MDNYKLAFSGEIIAGKNKAEVIQKVAESFQLSPEKARALFSGKEFIIKTGTLQAVQAVEATLVGCGAIAKVVAPMTLDINEPLDSSCEVRNPKSESFSAGSTSRNDPAQPPNNMAARDQKIFSYLLLQLKKPWAYLALAYLSSKILVDSLDPYFKALNVQLDLEAQRNVGFVTVDHPSVLASLGMTGVVIGIIAFGIKHMFINRDIPAKICGVIGIGLVVFVELSLLLFWIGEYIG